LIRLAIYLTLGISALLFFPQMGAPGIAFAEMAATVEAVILFVWLNQRLPERTVVRRTLLKGLAACLIGASVAYGLALMLPGGAILTAMVGIAIGGLIVIPIIWKDVRLLFNL